MSDGGPDLLLPLLLPHPPPSELHCAGHVLERMAGLKMIMMMVMMMMMTMMMSMIMTRIMIMIVIIWWRIPLRRFQGEATFYEEKLISSVVNMWWWAHNLDILTPTALR